MAMRKAGRPPLREDRIAGCNSEHIKEVLHVHPMDREACECECHTDEYFKQPAPERYGPHYIQ
jgi:hypothetical protein